MRRLEDLQTLTEDEKQLLREVKEAVLRYEPDAEVIIYGSAARGDREPESDYDVLVLVNRPLSVNEENEIDAAVYDVELARGVVISLILCPREDWESSLLSTSPYRRNVEVQGALV